MIDAPLALAFGTGMVATINPCGFAMLPAYLSYFLGLNDDSRTAWDRVLRALAVGIAVSSGFMAVFAIVGIVITKFSVAYQGKLPYVTMVMGVGIVVLGVLMLRGYQPTLSLPKMQKGTSSRQLSSMFLFGVSYAVSSLSCTIPLFLFQVANTFTRSDVVSGMAVFVAYASGMALVLMTLTMGLALARDGIVHRIRGLLPHLNTISGVLLIIAGSYLVYYGWYEARVLGLIDGGNPGGPGQVVSDWFSGLQGWITDAGATRIGIVLAGAIAVALLIAASYRTTSRRAVPGDATATGGGEADAPGTSDVARSPAEH